MTMMIALIALQAAAAGVAPAPARSGEAPPPVVRAARTATALPATPAVRGDVAVAGPAAVLPGGAASAIAVPSSARSRPDRAQVLAAVDAEWRRYDARGTGRLGPLEFATWVLAANGARVAPAGVKNAPGIKPVSAMNATARAFARADANHDGGVTREEMADFLIR